MSENEPGILELLLARRSDPHINISAAFAETADSTPISIKIVRLPQGIEKHSPDK
jgi:hypothetical protein